MYTITAAQGLAGEELWAAFSALRLLDEALDAAGTACVQARGLVEASHWQNRGVRALRWALSDLHAQLGRECSELQFQRDQLTRAVA